MRRVVTRRSLATCMVLLASRARTLRALTTIPEPVWRAEAAAFNNNALTILEGSAAGAPLHGRYRS